MSQERANVCVFGPTLFLTVTIEPDPADPSADELHFHPGGQGFWVARTLQHLGERPVFVTALGGESGAVLRALVAAWDVELGFVETADPAPAYLHDRRSGERREIGRSRMPKLDRHETDDLYHRALERAASAGACVVTGWEDSNGAPLDLYRRLGADLASTGVIAVGDLHGAELAAFLEGGPLHTLKLSDEDLEKDGELPAGASMEERVAAAARCRRRGARRVVISSRERTVALFEDRALTAVPPVLSEVDPRGAGDAMTAGLAAAAIRGLDAEAALRLGSAAGAASVTRRGLGRADPELVRELSERVAVETLEVPR